MLNSHPRKFDSDSVLPRLLVILNRSLPMYLSSAAPWTHRGDERAAKLLHHIVADQTRYIQKIVELLMDRRQTLSFGEFPMAFTDTHDLSLDYLVSELIFYQKQDVAGIQECVADLRMDLPARALAEEILGNAMGHLQSLEELENTPAGST
jgi:hypothetical protein